MINRIKSYLSDAGVRLDQKLELSSPTAEAWLRAIPWTRRHQRPWPERCAQPAHSRSSGRDENRPCLGQVGPETGMHQAMERGGGSRGSPHGARCGSKSARSSATSARRAIRRCKKRASNYAPRHTSGSRALATIVWIPTKNSCPEQLLPPLRRWPSHNLLENELRPRYKKMARKNGKERVRVSARLSLSQNWRRKENFSLAKPHTRRFAVKPVHAVSCQP